VKLINNGNSKKIEKCDGENQANVAEERGSAASLFGLTFAGKRKGE